MPEKQYNVDGPGRYTGPNQPRKVIPLTEHIRNRAEGEARKAKEQARNLARTALGKKGGR